MTKADVLAQFGSMTDIENKIQQAYMLATSDLAWAYIKFENMYELVSAEDQHGRGTAAYRRMTEAPLVRPSVMDKY